MIFKRLRLPSYDTWRRRRIKLIDELRRPEHWGLRPDDVLVRALPSDADGPRARGWRGGRSVGALSRGERLRRHDARRGARRCSSA